MGPDVDFFLEVRTRRVMAKQIPFSVWYGIQLGFVLLDILFQRILFPSGLPRLLNLRGKTVLVTGGTGGIGRSTAEQLFRLGADVILPCRDVAKGDKVASEIRTIRGDGDVLVLKMDLKSLASVREAVDALSGRRIDVLILNAGVMCVPLEETGDGVPETHFAVNHLAHFLLAVLLGDNLAKSEAPRVLVVSSVAGGLGLVDCEDLAYRKRRYSGFQGYADSKAANILFAEELARRTRSIGLTVYSVHPGEVITDISRNLPGIFQLAHHRFFPLILLQPDQGAWTSVYAAACEPSTVPSGSFLWHGDKVNTLVSPLQSGDLHAAHVLWQTSKNLVKPFLENRNIPSWVR